MKLKQLIESFNKFLSEGLKLTGKESREELEAMLDNPELSQEDSDTINDALANIDLKDDGEVAPITTPVYSTPLKINLQKGKEYTFAKKLVLGYPKDKTGRLSSNVIFTKTDESLEEIRTIKKSDAVTYDPKDAVYIGRLNDFNLENVKNYSSIEGRIIRSFDIGKKDMGIPKRENHYVFKVPELNDSIVVLSADEVNSNIWDTDELLNNIEPNESIQARLGDTPGKIKNISILPYKLISIELEGGNTLKFNEKAVINFLNAHRITYSKATKASETGTSRRDLSDPGDPNKIIDSEDALVSRINYIKSKKR